MDKDALVKKLSEYFKGRKDIAFAFLFGSVAQNRAHSESDVDIGVYFVPDVKTLEYESDKRYPTEQDVWSDLERLTGKQTDMVVLNRAPSTLFSAVLADGERLYSANDSLLYRLSAAVNDLASDFRDFITDFVKIKERSNSLSPNDRTRLLRALDFMQDQMPDFKDFAGVDQRQYEREVSVRRNIERWAETLANASIDIAKILIASAKRPIPQTYKSIMKELALLDGFDDKIALKLAKFSDMRNVLAHEYLDLRFALVGEFVKEGEPTYGYLVTYAKNILAREL